MAENKQYITQSQDNGSVQISEDVIATIASNAISEVEGIVGLSVKPGADIADMIGKKNWGKGLKVVDLGVDVPADAFLSAAREHNAQIIACSSLLTTTMEELRGVVDAVHASELNGKVRVMIGGAPVTQAFCDQIGADCFTPDAATAAEAALALCITD